jgi:nucleotide-binding universal stress UspA family protein
MSTSIEPIVVGVDGSDGSGRALDWASSLASAVNAEIVAVHVLTVPVYGGLGLSAVGMLNHDWREEVEAAFKLDWCDRLDGAGVKYRTIMVEGNPAPTLIEVAQREKASMIVAGARGSGGFKELLLGSVTHHLVHHARVPVVVVPPNRD